MDINNSDVIVGSGGEPGSDGSTAWVIHRGLVKNLSDLLPANSGWILNDTWGINDAGQIVGNGTLNGEPRGYVLTLGGLQQLATPPKVDDLSATTATGAPVTVPFQASTTTTSPLCAPGRSSTNPRTEPPCSAEAAPPIHLPRDSTGRTHSPCRSTTAP